MRTEDPTELAPTPEQEGPAAATGGPETGAAAEQGEAAETGGKPAHAGSRVVIGVNGNKLIPFDSARGRWAQGRRQELAARRALEGLRIGAGRVSSEPIRSWADAWRELAAVQAEKALGGDTPAFRAIGRAARLMVDRRDEDGSPAPAAGQLVGELAELLAAYREWKRADPDNQARADAARRLVLDG